MRNVTLKSAAFRFVLLMSVVSLFADMTYEGGRSVNGTFLAHLGASGLIVGVVAGLGEFVGFGLRYISGSAADRTRAHWTIVTLGYVINLLSIPALAFARTWPVAAALFLGERVGRGVRKPVVNAMLSVAGTELGHGWVFGFHEAMDQTGATLGPLLVAVVLAGHGGFPRAFASLAAPAVAALVVLTIARLRFPAPHALAIKRPTLAPPPTGRFRLYAFAGACLAAGFADFALLSYHFTRSGMLPDHAIPLLYAGAMLAAGAAAPFLGWAYDRWGMAVPIAAFALSATAVPLAFLGSLWYAVGGVVAWGVGMGAQETLLPAMLANSVPTERRATAMGAFDAIYGTAWLLGSMLLGALYDRNILAAALLSALLQLLALPILAWAGRLTPLRTDSSPARR